MTRPRANCKIGPCPKYQEFKPEGLKDKNCSEVTLTREEVETLRLKNLQNLHQTEAAKRMKISQSTFQRLLSSAYKKVSIGLIEGKPIRILEKKIMRGTT